MEFAVPEDWTVRFREPGRDPLTIAPGEEPGASAMLSNGAVLTALPVLEDAALVVLVTEPTVRPDYLAQRVEEFIPLESVTLSPRSEPYQANGLSGFASEGQGRLPNDGADVYFRTLVLEMAGRAILVTLYAEKSQQPRYEMTFDRILGSLRPLAAPPREGASPDPGDGLDEPGTPAPEAPASAQSAAPASAQPPATAASPAPGMLDPPTPDAGASAPLELPLPRSPDAGLPAPRDALERGGDEPPADGAPAEDGALMP